MPVAYGATDARRALLVASVVGTLLVAVSLAGLPLVARVALDYAVPFCVASVGALLGRRPPPRK